MIHQPDPQTQAHNPRAMVPPAGDLPANDPQGGPAPEPCPRCGTIAAPTLTEGTGMHALRASCGRCGRFLLWVSILSPSERLARKMKARLQAMQAHPPSEAQIEYLKALGDKLAAPQNMGEASERIEALKQRHRP